VTLDSDDDDDDDDDDDHDDFLCIYVYLCVNSVRTSISGESRLAVWRPNPCPFPSFLFPFPPFLSPSIALHFPLPSLPNPAKVSGEGLTCSQIPFESG